MKKLLLVLAMASTPSYGYDLLQPTNVGMEFEKYDALRDPYIPEDNGSWKYGSAMYLKISLFGDRSEKWRLFMDPKLHFRGTDTQIRQGGLYYETGFEILKEKGIRLFRRHQSDHVLERAREPRAFPINDSWVMQAEWEIK